MAVSKEWVSVGVTGRPTTTFAVPTVQRCRTWLKAGQQLASVIAAAKCCQAVNTQSLAVYGTMLRQVPGTIHPDGTTQPQATTILLTRSIPPNNKKWLKKVDCVAALWHCKAVI